MADPLSIGSAVVGGLGLALPTFQAAVDYYGGFKNAPKDIARMREELISLIDLLTTLSSSIKGRKIRPEVEAEIERHIQTTQDGIRILKDKLVDIWTDDRATIAQLPAGTKEANVTGNKHDPRLRKFKEYTQKFVKRGRYYGNRTIDRTKYPFREKTIQQLQDIIDRVKANLMLALQTLLADTGIETLDVVTALDTRFTRLEKEFAEYHARAGRITDRLRDDHEELQAAFKSQDRQEDLLMDKMHNQLTKLEDDVDRGLSGIIRNKDHLYGEVRDLRKSLEVKNDLISGVFDSVHERLVISTEDLAAKVQSVATELVLKIDPIYAHISIWREQMTRITNENTEAVKAVRDEVIPLKATVSNMDRCLQAQADGAFLKWLSPLTTGFEDKQNETHNLDCRQDRAASQFLESKEYLQWLGGSEGALWCLGGPGVGKTVLTSSIVHALQAELHDEEALIYMYCEHSEAKIYDPSRYSIRLLANIARQLGFHEGLPGRTYTKLHQRYTKSEASPTLAECREAMVAAATPYNKIFIIIDALDECPELSRARIYDELQSLDPRARILITSRVRFSKLYDNDQDKEITIRAYDSDIAEYIRASTDDFQNFLTDISRDKSFQEEIINGIVERAAGMFLLARYHTQSLRHKTDRFALEAALKSLPDELGPTYDEIIKRIEVRDPQLAAATKKLIKWVSLAMRPLTIEELCIALAVTPGDITLTPKKIPQRVAILKFCPDLFEVQKGDTLGFVHHSAHEHFATHFESEQALIASTCLTYLSLEPFEEGPCESAVSLKYRMASNPLFEYACYQWGHHAQRSAEIDIPKRALAFCQNSKTVLSCIQVARLDLDWLWSIKTSVCDITQSVSVPYQGRDFCSLWIAAYYGWYDLVRTLVDGPSQAKVPYAFGPWVQDHPYWVAVTHNYPKIVSLFIQRGVDVNTKDNCGLTAIQGAAKSGKVSLMLELLQSGADPNIIDDNGRTAFAFAVEFGNADVVSKLLSYCSDSCLVRANSDSGNTALHHAAMSSEIDVVTSLSQQMTKFDNSCEIKETSQPGQRRKYNLGRPVPRFLTGGTSHYAIMQVLIQKGAEINARNHNGQSALHLAAIHGNSGVVSRLIHLGAQINTIDNDGQTALTLAAKGGHYLATVFLIRHVSKLDDELNLNSLLTEVVLRRHHEVITLLLRLGAKFRQRTDHGEVVLIQLIKNQKLGYEDLQILRQLLDSWADPNTRDENGLTVLDYAIALGDTPTVDILREYGGKSTIVERAPDQEQVTKKCD